MQLGFLLLLLAGVLLLTFNIFKPFLAPIALAAIFSVVLQPLYIKLKNNNPKRAVVAALGTVLISILGILVPVFLLGTQIFQEAAVLYSTVSQADGQTFVIKLLTNLGSKAESFIPGTGSLFFNLSSNLDMYIREGLTWVVQHLGGALSSVSKLLLQLFIFLISLYYLLQDGPRLKQEIIKLSPLDNDDDTFIFQKLQSAVSSVVKGSLLIALIQGTLTAIGFTIFGVPNAVLWGTITVIAALIPGIGTALVLIPGIIYLFIVGNTFAAIGLLIWGIAAVGSIDNFLSPRLLGKNLELHPLLILLSVLGGIGYFGPIGLFVGPIVISLLFAFLSIYSYLFREVTHKQA